MYFLSRNTFHKHNYLLYKSKFTFYVFLLYRDWLTTTRQDHQWWLLFTVSWSLCLPPTVPTTWRNSSGQKWVLHQRCRCSGVIWSFLGPRGPLVEPSISASTRTVRENFSWVHRWAVTLPWGLRYPSNRIFYESWWCQLSKFGRKYKYKDKYRDKYKDRDK